MSRKGENIYKRKDGRWEARYIKHYDVCGKAKYGYLYARTYTEVKAKLNEIKAELRWVVPSIKNKCYIWKNSVCMVAINKNQGQRFYIYAL